MCSRPRPLRFTFANIDTHTHTHTHTTGNGKHECRCTRLALHQRSGPPPRRPRRCSALRTCQPSACVRSDTSAGHLPSLPPPQSPRSTCCLRVPPRVILHHRCQRCRMPLRKPLQLRPLRRINIRIREWPAVRLHCSTQRRTPPHTGATTVKKKQKWRLEGMYARFRSPLRPCHACTRLSCQLPRSHFEK